MSATRFGIYTEIKGTRCIAILVETTAPWPAKEPGRIYPTENIAAGDVVRCLDGLVVTCEAHDKQRFVYWSKWIGLYNKAQMLNRGTRTVGELYPAGGRTYRTYKRMLVDEVTVRQGKAQRG